MESSRLANPGLDMPRNLWREIRIRGIQRDMEGQPHQPELGRLSVSTWSCDGLVSRRRSLICLSSSCSWVIRPASLLLKQFCGDEKQRLG